jgi:peptidoglycan/LPS O-acetylase OafA/YrhL
MNATAIAEVSTPPSDPDAPRPRLHYLDGVRAVACLAVMVGHNQVVAEFRLPEWLDHWMPWCWPTVATFIVLSGYCLAIPIAKSHDLALLGGVSGYLKRRARRILPPYYAALGLCLLLYAAVFGMRPPTGQPARVFGPNTFPVFDPGVIVSHLLLIHNFNGRWSYAIDNPMWSVGTEWQIYFFLPLLLLPVWRKWGLAASVLTALVIGIGAGYLPSHDRWLGVPKGHFGFYVPQSPWYLGLFALGMAGAAINFSPRYAGLRDKPWGIVGFVALAGYIFTRLPLYGTKYATTYFAIYKCIEFPGGSEVFWGVAATCMLIVCTRRIMNRDGKLPLGLRFLGSRLFMALGIFSYSLYLIHIPVMQMLGFYTYTHFKPATSQGIILFCGPPLAVVIAYAFHRVFERPFMNLRSKGSNI